MEAMELTAHVTFPIFVQNILSYRIPFLGMVKCVFWTNKLESEIINSFPISLFIQIYHNQLDFSIIQRNYAGLILPLIIHTNDIDGSNKKAVDLWQSCSIMPLMSLIMSLMLFIKY